MDWTTETTHDHTGVAVLACSCFHAGEQVGRIDLGPKSGGYAPADLELLTTVATQATTAVANVRLATQLKEGLDELSISRVRLIAAQDAERRRIERDLHDGNPAGGRGAHRGSSA